MPKIDRSQVEPYARGVYPGKLRERTAGYSKLKLSDAGGLTQFGFGEVTLEPGGASGIYHWHAKEDELIYVLDGELTVVEGGETYTLSRGECATFKAGVEVGHTVENRSDAPCTFLELGTRDETERCIYPGLDMRFRRAAALPFETREGVTLMDDETPPSLDEADAYDNFALKRSSDD